MSRVRRWWLFGAAAAVTAVLFIDFCGWIYSCGCESLWAGGDAHCNIHSISGRHCPFCAIGFGGGVAVYATIVAAQALAAFGIRTLTPVARVVATFAAFPLTAGVIAITLGRWLGYWS